MSMRWRINDAVGSGISCLFDVIPSLRKFMTDSSEVDRAEERKMGGNLMGQRLKYMFCKLIRSISCRSRPLMLVLDDLQVSTFVVSRFSLVCNMNLLTLYSLNTLPLVG